MLGCHDARDIAFCCILALFAGWCLHLLWASSSANIGWTHLPLLQVRQLTTLLLKHGMLHAVHSRPRWYAGIELSRGIEPLAWMRVHSGIRCRYYAWNAFVLRPGSPSVGIGFRLSFILPGRGLNGWNRGGARQPKSAASPSLVERKKESRVGWLSPAGYGSESC